MLADNFRRFGHWISLNFCISVSPEEEGFVTVRECVSHAQETVLESKDAKTTGTGKGDEEGVGL